MQRIKAIDPDRATGKTRSLLAEVQKALGMIPNMMKTMAGAPAVLEGYLKFRAALGGGRLSARLREQIALAVAEANDSQYCLAAHTATGKSLGLSAADLIACRRFVSGDPKEEAALQLALSIVMTRGEASDRVVERVRRAGFSDEEIAEIVANVALNIFTNYFNKVAGVSIDFPGTVKQKNFAFTRKDGLFNQPKNFERRTLMNYTHNTPGLNGYDPVAYHTQGKPLKGNGWNVAEHKGVTYLFANEKNRKMFEADPEKFLPAYGGFCAYGVALKKKFASDPEVWRIEDGKLFLNLDTDIQKKWEKDLRGYIRKADANWLQIKEKAPAEL